MIVVYDLEIKNCIQGKNEERDSNYEYCNGWTDYKGMGISSLVAYDFNARRYRIFGDENKKEFDELVDNSKFVVGFNSNKFDNKVVQACWGINILQERSFDIMKEIIKTVFDTENTNAHHKGFGLNATVKANFNNVGKSGHGANAPRLYQDGKLMELVDYNLEDVRITKMLFLQILNFGFIIDPRDNNNIIRFHSKKLDEIRGLFYCTQCNKRWNDTDSKHIIEKKTN